MSEKYNGWTNYETWVVKLWIDNDEGSQNYWMDCAHDADTTIELADQLKQAHDDDFMPDSDTLTGVYADLMGAALSNVDWYEIAEALLEDAGELDE